MKLQKEFQDDVLKLNGIRFMLESKFQSINVKNKLYLNIINTNFLSDK